MPAQAGIHDFPRLQQRKSWMAARSLPSGVTRGAAMTGLHRQWVVVSAGWYYILSRHTNRPNQWLTATTAASLRAQRRNPGHQRVGSRQAPGLLRYARNDTATHKSVIGAVGIACRAVQTDVAHPEQDQRSSGRPGPITPSPIQRRPVQPACQTSHLPNPYAIMNDRINHIEPEQYPRVPHWFVTNSPLIRA